MVVTKPNAPTVSPTEPATCFPTERQFFGLLLLYFGLQVLSRCLLFDAAELDEGEQLILTQELSWRHGAQPPLYTWIQGFSFAMFGVNLFALSLVKNCLLFCTYALTYWSAKRVTRDHKCGVVAALSLLFIPQIAWESQRDLTHSVLLTTVGALTLLLLLKIFEQGRTWHYLALGLSIGLGFLSKYNYAVFLIGLVGSALSIRRFRSALLNLRLLTAFGVVVLLAIIAVQSWDKFDSVNARASNSLPNEFRVLASLAALGEFLVNVLLFAAPLLIFFGVVFREWVFRRRNEPELSEHREWLSRSMISIIAMMALIAASSRMGEVKERWLQPLSVLLPVLVVICIRGELTQRRLRTILYFVGSIGAVVLLTISAGMLSPVMARPMRLNAPFRELSAKLAILNSSNNVVLAENRWIGGNLRLYSPGSRILAPEFQFKPPAQTGQLLLIWNATRSDAPPLPLLKRCREFGFITNVEALSFVEAPYKFAPTKKMRLGMFLAPQARPEP
jgi:lipopolysaccharide core galacturonosyltransferase RgtB